jgi:3-oxoacyl-[acyl-carrier-protein] synthase II
MRRRVAITGIGAITPIGNGAEGLWSGVLRGTSAVERVTRFDPSHFQSQVAAHATFAPLDYLSPQRARRLDRYSQLALIASRQAIEDAGIEVRELAAQGAGAYIGSALGGVAYGEEQHAAYVHSGTHGVSPLLALSVFGGAASSNISIEFKLSGPCLAYGNSCAAGMIAIGEAARLIGDGRATVMLAGGAEAPLAPLTFGAFSLIRVLSTRNNDPATASRPFDRDRDGFVMAEGSCVLVLEDAEYAAARGARVYAQIDVFGTTNDAYHMTAPHPDGVFAGRAICQALAEAGLPAEEIGYVNAHGSSTVLNDSTECKAIRIALGRHAERVAVSGTKGLHGHALGATGAMETAICAMALQRGMLPGTATLQHLDPACDLDLIPPEGRVEQVEHLVTNAFGFGGVNASVVMSVDS